MANTPWQYGDPPAAGQYGTIDDNPGHTVDIHGGAAGNTGGFHKDASGRWIDDVSGKPAGIDANGNPYMVGRPGGGFAPGGSFGGSSGGSYGGTAATTGTNATYGGAAGSAGGGSAFDAASAFSAPSAGASGYSAAANPAWYQSIGKAFTGANAYQNWLQAAGLGLAAYQTYRNSQPPKFKDPGLTPEQKRLSDLYFQSLTNPAMANNASHVTDVSNTILNNYMKANDGSGLQWNSPQTFSGQNGGAPVRQAWPGAPAAGAPVNANAGAGTGADPHAAILNERNPQVQQLAMWIVVNNPTLPPDRALEQARMIVLHSSGTANSTVPAASSSMRLG